MYQVFQQHSPNENPPSYYDIENDPKVLSKDANVAEEAEPPSYTSYLHQMDQRVEQINNYVNVAGSDSSCFEKFIILFALILNAVILPIAMIIIGYSSFNYCTAQPRLPILIILYGLAKFLFYFGVLFDTIIKYINRNVEMTRSNMRKFMTYILFGILLVCFLNGNVFAYKSSNDYSPCLAQIFLFWYITSVWFIIGLVLLSCILVNLCKKSC